MFPARPFEIQPRPLPFERVVKWLPLDDSYYLLASAGMGAVAEPVVLAQDALLQVEHDLRHTQHRDAFGILSGAICICPDSGLQYVLVEGTMDARGVAIGDDPYATMAAELSALARTAERSGKLVVGWYRTGATLFPRVALHDVAVHRTLFPHPWQVALLRDGIGPQNRGALLRVEPTEGRPYSIPFYELLPPPSKYGTGITGASVTWSNYRAELEMTPAPDALLNGRVAPSRPTPLLPPSVQPAPRANGPADAAASARATMEPPSPFAPPIFADTPPPNAASAAPP
ncbi:MAG: hypothetical protein IRY91_06980, partial [Gemmatimonadaceae bacterium]|nr:hypothetical protein [Gemmatimonadaceae bacterium]